MVILGLLLILLGALCIIAVVFDVNSVGAVELLGAEISPLTLFLLGVGSGVAVLWGFGILKWGTKRSLKHRREQKELQELNEKLDRAEADQRKDDEDRERH